MNHDDHACLVFTISAMKIYVHVYVHINHASNVMCIYSSFMNEAPDRRFRRTIGKGQWSKFKFDYLLLNVTEFRWKYYICKLAWQLIGTQERFQFLPSGFSRIL